MDFKVIYKDEITQCLSEDPKMTESFFYSNVAISIAYILIVTCFMIKYGHLLTRFNFWLMVSFSLLITLRGIIYIITKLLLNPVMARQLVQNNSCMTIHDYIFFELIHELADILEFLLFQFYYIILFSMRQINLTLALTSENVHTHERKTVTLYRDFKRFMVFYNVLFLLKIMVDGTSDILSSIVKDYY